MNQPPKPPVTRTEFGELDGEVTRLEAMHRETRDWLDRLSDRVAKAMLPRGR